MRRFSRMNRPRRVPPSRCLELAGLREGLAALQEQVASLEGQMGGLKAGATTHQTRLVGALAQHFAALSAQIASATPGPALQQERLERLERLVEALLGRTAGLEDAGARLRGAAMERDSRRDAAERLVLSTLLQRLMRGHSVRGFGLLAEAEGFESYLAPAVAEAGLEPLVLQPSAELQALPLSVRREGLVVFDELVSKRILQSPYHSDRLRAALRRAAVLLVRYGCPSTSTASVDDSFARNRLHRAGFYQVSGPWLAMDLWAPLSSTRTDFAEGHSPIDASALPSDYQGLAAYVAFRGASHEHR